MNRIRQAIAVLVAAAAIGTAVPAASAAASTPSISTSVGTAATTANQANIPLPRWVFGWRIYWRWNAAMAADVAQGSTHVLAGALGVACGFHPNKAAGLACGAAVGGIVFAVHKTFTKAAFEGKCVEIRVSYAGIPTSWRRYNC